jgi:hypothetical protein
MHGVKPSRSKIGAQKNPLQTVASGCLRNNLAQNRVKLMLFMAKER